MPYRFSRTSVKFQGHAAKKSSILTQIGRFRTVTPVWIHQWLRNGAETWISMEEVPYRFSRTSVKFQGHAAKKSSILTQIGRFRTVTPVWIHQWLRNGAETWISIEEVPYRFSRTSVKFQGHAAKKSSILTQIGRFRTVTPVWIHQWLWNDAQSLEQHRRGALLFSRSSAKFQGRTGQKIADFDPNWAFPDCNSILNSLMALKWCTKYNIVKKMCSIVFQGHPWNSKVTRLKNPIDFDSNWAFPDCNSSLDSPMGTKLCTKLEEG